MMKIIRKLFLVQVQLCTCNCVCTNRTVQWYIRIRTVRTTGTYSVELHCIVHSYYRSTLYIVQILYGVPYESYCTECMRTILLVQYNVPESIVPSSRSSELGAWPCPFLSVLFIFLFSVFSSSPFYYRGKKKQFNFLVLDW